MAGNFVRMKAQVSTHGNSDRGVNKGKKAEVTTC